MQVQGSGRALPLGSLLSSFFVEGVLLIRGWIHGLILATLWNGVIALQTGHGLLMVLLLMMVRSRRSTPRKSMRRRRRKMRPEMMK